MEDEKQIKAYFKEIVLRIQIALAIAVIRTTPPGATAKEHARSIQAIFKLKSLGTEHKDFLNKHEQEVLHLQQKVLLSRLWRVTQNNNLQQQKCSSDLTNMTAEYAPADGICANESQELLKSDLDDISEQNIEPNLQFIHAIAHLTSVINSFTIIPMDEYHKILLSAATDLAVTNPCTEKDMCSNKNMISSLVGQDAIHFKDRRCISSDMVKYVMHSSNGREILVHSVQCVLQYLSQSINVENEIQMEKLILSWRGSLLEYAVKSILDLVDCTTGEDEQHNQYHQMCIDFIQNIINGILGNNSFHKHQTWEQICAVVLEVGNNKHICFRMIDYLIERVKCMNKNLKSKDNISGEYFGSLDIEKSFYLFYLLEHFIKTWKNLCNFGQSLSNTSKISSKSSNSFASITDLWRRKWSDSTTVKQEKINSEEKEIISKWNDVLQDCLMNCKEQYPLIMTYLWECSLLLESVDLSL